MDATGDPALAELAFRWEAKYDIDHDEATGAWSATHKASADQLTGRTADELRQTIRDDHRERHRAEQRQLARLQERSST